MLTKDRLDRNDTIQVLWQAGSVTAFGPLVPSLEARPAS